MDFTDPDSNPNLLTEDELEFISLARKLNLKPEDAEALRQSAHQLPESEAALVSHQREEVKTTCPR